MTLHLALYEPEIPPNTGNIMRLAANMGASLHLIHPLGFSLEEKALRRAGLDYRDQAVVQEHVSFDAFLNAMDSLPVFACTTKATQCYTTPSYPSECVLLMGPETRGLPESYLNTLLETEKIRIPMCAESRSLNLSNATAIIAYEVWRQWGFPGKA